MNKPFVFSDFFHGALYYSFHLLVEKRLGGTLMRPTGYDWYKKGFWGYHVAPGVIKQYLEPPSKDFLRDGIYYVPAQEGTIRYIQKAVTFDKFLELDFDFVITCIANHEASFHNLIQEHKPEAVLIRQLGTPFERCNWNISRNIFNPTTKQIPADVNMVRYHPEFSLEDYCYTPPTTHNAITNIMHALPTSPVAPLWYEYKKAMADYVWKMHGFGGEDGVLPEHLKAKAFQNSSFIFHLKWCGDGYGFVIHNAYACGRPCIVKGSHYRHLTAGSLLEDSVTCIDLELGSKEQNIEKIRHFSKPENHVQMCKNAHNRFKEVVDFDKEFEEIKKFLEKAKKK